MNPPWLPRAGRSACPMPLSARLSETVEARSGHDDHTDQNLAGVARNAADLAAVREHGHEERAEQRAEDAPATAAERAATEHHRGDDVELRAGRRRGVALAEAADRHHP